MGMITEATTTGPASGPRPASSIPQKTPRSAAIFLSYSKSSLKFMHLNKKKSRLAAGVAPVQGASLSVFGYYKKHLRHFFIFYSERIAARAPRFATSVKQEQLKRTVLPKRVNVPLLLKKLLSKRNRGETGLSPTSPTKFFFRLLLGDLLLEKRICAWSPALRRSK